AHRAQAHIKIRETHPEQTDPGPQHVPAIQATHTLVTARASWRFRELVQKSADQVTQRVTTASIAAEEDDIGCQHERAHAYAKRSLARGVGEPKRLPRVVGEDHDESQGEIKKIAMDILNDQWQRVFSEVTLAWLAHGA